MLILSTLIVRLVILRVTNLRVLAFDFNFCFASELHDTLGEDLPDFVSYDVF